MRLFALASTRPFGDRVAEAAGIALNRCEERLFADGEHKFRPLDSVRGEDVYVIHSLYGEPAASVNDKFCQLLFFLGAVRDAGAARVTAIVPYLPFSRKDRRTQPNDPLTTRYVAQLIEAMGVDLVVTIDVHNISAFENAFRRPVIHLETRALFAARLKPDLADERIVVASPDPGGVKRAQLFRETLESTIGRPVGFALMEKRRVAGVVSGDMIAGDVAGAFVLIVDDLISTGGTIARAAHSFREAGAQKAVAIAAHGLFVGDAPAAIATPDLERIYVTDAVPPFRLPLRSLEGRLEIVSAAPLIAETIRSLHDGRPFIAGSGHGA